MDHRLRDIRLVRFSYVAALIGRVVLDYRLLSLRKKQLSPQAYEERLHELHLGSAQRIYDGVLQLQGLMIKIGQTLGSRPDLLPEEYVRVLSRLQDQVPPRPFREMRPHIERELGARIEDVFAEFDPQPVAAASLAQVYKARLNDGRQVAVKVVYPDTEQLVDTDLKILKAAIWLEARFFALPLQPVYDELSANIPHEVDMIHEGHNMEALTAQMSHRREVVVPEVIWEQTRKKVLTMEYIDGIKITDLSRAVAAGIDPKVMAQLVADVYFEQVFKHGHFHADPHPGNLFALPGNRLAIVDFGLTKQFTPQFQTAFKAMARSIFNGDNDGLTEAMKAAGFVFRREGDDGPQAIAQMFSTMADRKTWTDKDVVEAAYDAWLKALKRNPMVQMPGEVALAIRVFSLLFGLAAVTGAEANAVQSILKYSSD